MLSNPAVDTMPQKQNSLSAQKPIFETLFDWVCLAPGRIKDKRAQ
jgi:hypothetical protein